VSALLSSSFCFSALRFSISISYIRALSIFIAVERFLCCERSLWQATTRPLGTWGVRGAGSGRGRGCPARGARPAEGIGPLDAYRGTLDAGHLAVGLFDQLGLEAAPLGPAQVHAQQHGRPILRLGAAGSPPNFAQS